MNNIKINTQIVTLNNNLLTNGTNRINSAFQSLKSSYYSQLAASIYCKTSSELKSVASSVAAKFLYKAVRENVLEGIGYYSVAAVTGPIASSVMGTVMRNGGFLTGNGAALAVAGLAGHYASSKIASDQGSQFIKVAAVVTLTAIPLLYVLPSAFANIAEGVGQGVGSYIGSLAGGIVGGCMAIRLVGSEEVIWDKDRISRTYTLKTIQCTAGMALIDCLNLPVSGIFKLASNQMLGSLIYNALDISDVVKQFSNAELLDGYLPARLNSQVVDNKTILELSDHLTPLLLKNLSAQDKIKNIISQSIYQQLAQELESSFSQEIFKEGLKLLLAAPIKNDLLSKKEQVMYQALEEKLRPFTNELLLKANQTDLGKKGTDQLFAGAVNSLNQYIGLFASDTVKEAQADFMESLKQYMEAKAGPSKEIARSQLKAKQLILQNALSLLMQKSVFKGTIMELKTTSNLVMKGLDLYQQHAPLFSIDPANLSLTDVQQFLKLRMMTVFQLDEKEALIDLGCDYSLLAQQLNDQAQLIEKKLVGFSFSSQKQKVVIEHMLSVHLPLIAKLFAFNLCQSHDIPEKETRDFYLNVTHLACGYYQSIVGGRLSDVIQTVLDRQITHAKLK